MGHRARWLAALVAAVASSTLLAAAPAQAGEDTTPPAPFDFVADAGDYQTGYSVASPYSNIYVWWEPAVDAQSAVTYEITVDGVVARTVTDAYGSSVINRRVEVPEGSSVVSVTAIDASGNRRSSTHSLDVVVDKVDPWFTSHPLIFLRPGPITDQGYPMRFTWSGDDEGTGLVAARIGPNADCCYTLPPTLTHYDFAVPPRSEIVYRMWLVDGVGRVAKTPRSGYVDLAKWRDTRHSRGWDKANDGTALNGWEWRSDRKGAWFDITTAGKSIGWVTSTGPNRGRADVMVGHKVVATVNLYSPKRRPARVVWAGMLSRQEAKTITIVNTSPKSRSTVGVGAFLVHS